METAAIAGGQKKHALVPTQQQVGSEGGVVLNAKASRPTATCDLFPSERSFLDEMRRLGHGRYESLKIHNGELILTPWPTAIRDVKFGAAVSRLRDNVTTLRNNRDQTVVLRVGDPFIYQDSVVFYADAQIVDAGRLIANVAANMAQQHKPCSAALLKLVQDGILGSPHTPKKGRYVRSVGTN